MPEPKSVTLIISGPTLVIPDDGGYITMLIPKRWNLDFTSPNGDFTKLQDILDYGIVEYPPNYPGGVKIRERTSDEQTREENESGE